MRQGWGWLWIGLAAAVLSGAAALAPPAPATAPALRPLGPDELVVFLELLRSGAHGPVPVPLEHRFAAGDRFLFEVTLSRGGYLALAKLDARGLPAQRVWPRESAGHPVTAQTAVRLPPVGSLQLRGTGPTGLALLISLTPLAGRLPPAGPAPAPPVASRHRWLEQVRLRDVVVDPRPLPELPPLAFQGTLRAQETAGIRLVLQHPGGPP
jgi:hypothetical protein